MRAIEQNREQHIEITYANLLPRLGSEWIIFWDTGDDEQGNNLVAIVDFDAMFGIDLTRQVIPGLFVNL